MQILHITGQIDPKLGGVGQAIRTMIRGLEDLGFQSEVVTLDDPNASFLKEESCTINTPGSGSGPWCYNSNLVPWLTGNLNRFDVVIVHGLWSYFGYAVRKAIRILRRQQQFKNRENSRIPKVFIMPHGMLDPYFQVASGRKLKAIRNWSYWKLIERKIVNGADGILFTCKEEQRLARQPFHPYNPKRETVVGLGVQEPPPFTQSMREAFLENCPSLGNRPYLLFLSRIHEKKGVDMLINAYKNYSGFNNENMPALVIAGPGLDTPYGENIRSLVLESPVLRTSVIFTGMLTGDAKWGAFYGCDAFVLPSHQENFGIALVESMACHKPVLISNQVNIWQEVVAAGGGIVAEDTNLGTLHLINSWLSLSAEAKLAMGLKARSCYESRFAMDTAAMGVVAAVSS